MNRYLVIAIIAFLGFSACQKKNNASKIPQIVFVNMAPDSIQAGSDTVFINFNFSDGDADIGNTPNANNNNYDIFIQDSRFDTGYTGYFFPAIDQSIEDPTKGITGTIIFKQLGALILPRDSLHMVTGDTLHYELYIKDRAGNSSNHITTPNLYVKP